MKKINLMIAALSVFSLTEGSLAMEDSSLTLAIGNCRQPGQGKKAVLELVEQDEADFTHKKSFPGSVVSVDLVPLKQSLARRYQHLTLDFIHTPSNNILSQLNDIRPTCIFFEWFPSYISGVPQQNLTPLLLPALKNAFEILAPGGKIIIDHMAHTVSLPSDFSSALKKLREIQVNTKYLSEALNPLDSINEPGFVTGRLQKADPFSYYSAREEDEEIRNCLMFRIKNNDQPFDDTNCKFITDKIINDIISQMMSSFKTKSKIELMTEISNGMLYSYREVQEERQGYWDLFEQHYYMKTREPLILRSLQEIGFIVESDSIQYHHENPYNHRKFAHLITVKKADL